MYSQSAIPLINTCTFQPQYAGTSTSAVETMTTAAASAVNSARSTAEGVLRFPLHSPHVHYANGGCSTAKYASSGPAQIQPQPSRRKDSLSNVQSTASVNPTVHDVFLGGSCGKTVWRQDLVIPYLQKRGITYYDPQKPTWSENMIYEEAMAKENSKLFLFVLDPGNINATSFLEIAYLAARKAPRLVVVFLGRREWSDKAHPMDLPDRIRTCHLLEAILKRHSVPMLASINAALDCVDDMIIGEQTWRSALGNPLQRLPFLRVRWGNLARSFCHMYKQTVSRLRQRFGAYAQGACVILALETILTSLLILVVFKSTVPAWAIIAPIVAFNYFSLIIVFLHFRFKARQSKEKLGAKVIISSTPIPRIIESATLLEPCNSTNILSFPNSTGIYKTAVWKQTSTETPAIPYSTSLPEDMIVNDSCGQLNDETTSNSERFLRRRSSAKSKRKDGEEDSSQNGGSSETVDSDLKSSSATKEFVCRLADTTTFADSEEVRCDMHRFNDCGRRVLHQCSVYNASAEKSPDSDIFLTGQQHRQRRDTIASTLSDSKEEPNIEDLPQTVSTCGSFISVGYDVFLSCSSSSELDWITQKAVPQLHKSCLSYTSALMCDKEMRIPILHTASHILYYIPSYKTFLSGMIEIAYFIGHWDWQVTVCVPREAECLIPIETASAENNNASQPRHRALCAAVERRNECYRMAFLYLKDMAQRRQCRVFARVEDAIKYIASDKNRCSSKKRDLYGGARLQQIVEKQHLVKTAPIDVAQSRIFLDDSNSPSGNIDFP